MRNIYIYQQLIYLYRGHEGQTRRESLDDFGIDLLTRDPIIDNIDRIESYMRIREEHIRRGNEQKCLQEVWNA